MCHLCDPVSHWGYWLLPPPPSHHIWCVLSLCSITFISCIPSSHTTTTSVWLMCGTTNKTDNLTPRTHRTTQSPLFLLDHLFPANAGFISLCSIILSFMSSNIYLTHVALQEGISEREVRATASPASRRTFPCVIAGRQFDCEEDYLSELHDYLNGNWVLPPYRVVYHIMRFLSDIACTICVSLLWLFVLYPP